MSERLSISGAFELYRLEHIVYLNQSKKTEEMSYCAMNALLNFVGDIMIDELTFDKIRQWKSFLERNKGQNTVRGYIIKLRVVLRHLKIKGYQNVLNYEMVGVPKKLVKVVDFVSPEEVNRMITAAYAPTAGYNKINRYRNRAIISLLYASGIRVSELCGLDRASLKEDNTFTVMGKGNKARLCFFDSRTRDYVDSYLELRRDKSIALFLSELTQVRITPNVTQIMFINVTKKAGFTKQIHPHTMRHSFATNMLKNNTNLLYVKDFLGHTSVQTTEMYMHVVNEDLRSIYMAKHTI